MYLHVVPHKQKPVVSNNFVKIPTFSGFTINENVMFLVLNVVVYLTIVTVEV